MKSLPNPNSPYNNLLKMASSKLKVAILIISQTAARDPSTDTCADILRDVFENEGANKWDIPESKIVPDSILDIQRAVTAWTDGSDPVNLIISSGGTGFAVNDHTPEVSALYCVDYNGG